MDCSGPKIKKMLYFHKKAFLVRSETELYTPKTKKFQKGILRASKMKKKPTLKEFLMFQEMELSTPKLKKLLFFF